MNPETKITGMQTTIKIPDREIERLDKLREAEGISRAELIRRGISAYLATLQPDEAFGAWRQIGHRWMDRNIRGNRAPSGRHEGAF